MPQKNFYMLENNDIFDLKNCRLCPRCCGVDRYKNHGFCGAPAQLTAARASLHLWEEPCIAGDKGAGTVFFTYCQLGCVYCQNYAISSRPQQTMQPFGKEISVRELTTSFLRLQSLGAATIDLVTPTHYAPQIIEALRLSRQGISGDKLTIPAVWNSSGYEAPEMVQAIAEDIDIFMPDFKYFDRKTALRYSNAPDYPERAMEAITAMVRAKGAPVFFPGSQSGHAADDCSQPRLKSGVIIRHLVLPGHRHESIALVQELYRRFGDGVILSLMNQYTPIAGAAYLTDFPELRRKLTKFEYDSVVEAALDAGFTNAFIQQGGTVSESFIPIFDGRGL